MTKDKTSPLQAAVIIIGNEILSGRTQDKNVQYIAAQLSAKGIALVEVRVVRDIEEKIVEAVNTLRKQVDYVFTTGGIGPTHDDITAASVAKAFGVLLQENEDALAMMRRYYDARDQEITSARAKMAMVPEGATLIPNPVSGAPGFVIDNVYVMAGVPGIMQAMFDDALSNLQGGAVIHSETVDLSFPESTISEFLAALQDEFPDVEIGSYPQISDNVWTTAIVLRCTDQALINAAAEKLRAASFS